MDNNKGDRADAAPRRRAASRAPIAWLPPLLFWLSLGISVGLVALVTLTPWLHLEGTHPRNIGRVLTLFAQDVTLRRTSLASAAGLVVTACVFFRTPAATRSTAPRKPARPAAPPPPTNIVGA